VSLSGPDLRKGGETKQLPRGLHKKTVKKLLLLDWAVDTTDPGS